MTNRRVVVVGATGNVGTALLERLSDADDVSYVTGVARRLPDRQTSPYDVASWTVCDIAAPGALAELVRAFDGADAVVHLAWRLQPSHDEHYLWRVNVAGTRTVFEAAAQAGVGHVVYASSVGAYGPGPKDRSVDESWSTAGVASSSYSRQKAEVEGWLDGFETRHPEMTVTRLRPGLIFQRRAANEIARYFLGPFVPTGFLGRVPLPFLPLSPRMIFQAVHASDVAEAYLAAIRAGEPGAFNIAAEPVLEPRHLAAAFRARTVLPVPLGFLRGSALVSWYARLQVTEPGWIDLAGSAPVMDVSRARTVLGWSARISSTDALAELVAGMADRAGHPSPPLEPGKRPANA